MDTKHMFLLQHLRLTGISFSEQNFNVFPAVFSTPVVFLVHVRIDITILLRIIVMCRCHYRITIYIRITEITRRN